MEWTIVKPYFFFFSGPCLDGVQEGLVRVLTPDRRLGLMMSDSGLEEEQVMATIIASEKMLDYFCLIFNGKQPIRECNVLAINMENVCLNSLSVSPQCFK